MVQPAGQKETKIGRSLAMAGVHLLDRIIGSEYPNFATDDDVRAFEQVPYSDRIAAASTYDAIKLAATRYPDAPALQFLANADPADTANWGQSRVVAGCRLCGGLPRPAGGRADWPGDRKLARDSRRPGTVDGSGKAHFRLADEQRGVENGH